MHHALVMIWLFVLLKVFQQRGVRAGRTTAPKGTQGDFLGVLVDRSGFRDSRVIGVRGLPSVLPFLNALTRLSISPRLPGIVTCIQWGQYLELRNAIGRGPGAQQYRIQCRSGRPALHRESARRPASSAPAAALTGITAVCQSITCGASKFRQ